MKVSEYKKLVKPRESDIQNECIAYLESQGYYVQRLNAGGYKMAGGFVHGVKAGTPDIMCFKEGDCDPAELGNQYEVHAELIFIEVKRPGGKITLLQEKKIEELREYGARCMVVYSLEELQDYL